MPFLKKLTAEWGRGSDKIEELVWHIPNEDFPKISDFKDIQIRENERAFLVSSGLLKKFLVPGRHSIPKDVDEIVWVDVSPKRCPFGIGKSRGLLSADQKKVGLGGFITFRIGDREEDLKSFIKNFLSGQNSFEVEKIESWLREHPLSSVFRGVVKNFTHEQLSQIDCEKLSNFVIPKLADELQKYGIDICGVDITHFANTE